MTLETPQGGIPDVGHAGFKIPTDRVDESHNSLGSQPNTVPEPQVVPNSGRQPLSKEGEPLVPMTSVHPEAPDNLLEALQGASIDEEHHTLMSTVIEKVQSAKSGLTEACASLLIGFEVSNQIIRKCYRIDSSPWCSAWRLAKKGRIEDQIIIARV